MAALLLAGELAVLPQTIKCFKAGAQITARRGEIREARLGFETAFAAKVADLYESVDATRGRDRVRDALARSEFVEPLKVIATYAPSTLRPAVAERRLRRAWHLLAACLVVAHVSAPAGFVDNIKGDTFIPHPGDHIAAWVFGGAVVASIIAALVLWRCDEHFERVLQDGIEARG